MAHKGDWQSIKSMLSGSAGGRNRTITPVFIHWNEHPVRANPEAGQFFGASDHEFSYLVTLFKKRGKYQADLYFYVTDFDKEKPLMTETKHFSRYEFKELFNFITTPSKIFKLKNQHKNVRHYSEVRMTEEEFDYEVQICRGKQT